MKRDQKLTVYVTPEKKQRLEERTEGSHETVSGYINTAIEQRLQAEADDEVARELRAEERIRELVTLAADEIRQATTDMRELNAKTGAYAAANFELLKHDHKDALRRDALQVGAQRMRDDLDQTVADLDHAASAEDETDLSERLAESDSDDSDDNGPDIDYLE